MKRIIGVLIAGVLVFGGFAAAYAGDKVDQSACEVAAQTRISGIITEGLADLKERTAAAHAEAPADFNRARILVNRIESSCEGPNDGHGGGDNGGEGDN